MKLFKSLIVALAFIISMAGLINAQTKDEDQQPVKQTPPEQTTIHRIYGEHLTEAGVMPEQLIKEGMLVRGTKSPCYPSPRVEIKGFQIPLVDVLKLDMYKSPTRSSLKFINVKEIPGFQKLIYMSGGPDSYLRRGPIKEEKNVTTFASLWMNSYAAITEPEQNTTLAKKKGNPPHLVDYPWYKSDVHFEMGFIQNGYIQISQNLVKIQPEDIDNGIFYNLRECGGDDFLQVGDYQIFISRTERSIVKDEANPENFYIEKDELGKHARVYHVHLSTATDQLMYTHRLYPVQPIDIAGKAYYPLERNYTLIYDVK